MNFSKTSKTLCDSNFFLLVSRLLGYTTISRPGLQQSQFHDFKLKILSSENSTRTLPGPFAPPGRSLPRRKMTALSYSCTTFSNTQREKGRVIMTISQETPNNNHPHAPILLPGSLSSTTHHCHHLNIPQKQSLSYPLLPLPSSLLAALIHPQLSLWLLSFI